MNVLIISKPVCAENTFPLYNALLEKGVNATYLFSNNSLCSTLFDVKKKVGKVGIIPAILFPEIKFYEQYIDMNKVFVLNDKFGKRHPLKSLYTIISLLCFIKKKQFNVIHVDFALYGWYNFLYLFKNRIIFTQHDPFVHSGTVLSDSVQKRLERSHRLLKKFVILNKSQYPDFCSHNNINPAQVLVNQFGSFDYVQLFHKKDVQRIPNRLIFWGRISKYKGIEYLCEAMTIVHDVIPDASLIIAGGGELYFDYTPFSDLSYIKLINKFVDSKDLISMADESDVAVFPYTDSTQSGCVITAYTLGMPVITTDTETMREIVDEGKSAITVPVRDSKALADAIIKLLNDKKLQSEMRDYLSNTFFTGQRSWSVIADKYMEFYSR